MTHWANEPIAPGEVRCPQQHACDHLYNHIPLFSQAEWDAIQEWKRVCELKPSAWAWSPSLSSSKP